MHELSIALGIVRQLDERAAERGITKIHGVTLRIGSLSGVDKAALDFAWELAAAGSIAAGSQLHFEEVELKVRCTSCGVERIPPTRWQLACPSCPLAPPEIIAGRELHIVAMEVPDDHDR